MTCVHPALSICRVSPPANRRAVVSTPKRAVNRIAGAAAVAAASTPDGGNGGDDDDNDDSNGEWVELTVKLSRESPEEPLGFAVSFKQATPDGRARHPTVKHVAPSSGAEASGLRSDDTIVSVDDVAVAGCTPADLIVALSKTTTTLVVRRRLPPPPTLSPLELKRAVAAKGVVSPPPRADARRRDSAAHAPAVLDFMVTVDKMPDAPKKPLEFGVAFRGSRCFVSKAPTGEDEAVGGLRKGELAVGDEIIAINGEVLANVPRLTMSWLTDAISKRKVVLSVCRDASSRPGDCSVT
jgi:hypothetical protein